MVVKIIIFILLMYFPLVAQNKEQNHKMFWKEIFLEAFSNTPQMQKIENDYQVALINYQQQKQKWIPKFSFTFPQTATIKRGDYTFVQGYNKTLEYVSILNPSFSLSISQQLPGNGTIQIKNDYGFNFFTQKNSFLQTPSLSFSVTQNLGYGFLGFGGDPEFEIAKNQLYYNTLCYEKGLLDVVESVTNIIKNFDNQNAEKKYYDTLLKVYEAKYKEMDTKSKQGINSELDLFYAKEKLTNLRYQISITNYEKNSIATEMEIIIPSLSAKLIEEFRSDLLKLFDFNYGNISKTINEEIYINLINLEILKYKKNEIQFTPSIFIQSSIHPDANIYYTYSDWDKSIRTLFTSPYPFIINFSTGIQINFSTPKEIKLRKSICKINITTLEKEMYMLSEQEKKERNLLTAQIKSLESFCKSLEENLIEERKICFEREKLFTDGIITNENFLNGELTFAEVYRRYINTFWELIEKRINYIRITNNYKTFITNLGEYYYED